MEQKKIYTKNKNIIETSANKNRKRKRRKIKNKK